MIEQTAGFLRFSNLAQCREITHFITTRAGGVSRPPYDSLNLGFGTRDDPNDVLQNRKILSLSVHFPGALWGQPTPDGRER